VSSTESTGSWPVRLDGYGVVAFGDRPVEAVLEAIPGPVVAEAAPTATAPMRPSPRRSPIDPAARRAAQRRLAERALRGLDRERLIATGHEAWGTAGNDS
jgi:hypothetical protein